jgi:NAD(P)-dependent dehydrogenase (short-subunit alcohol dehydrogenase family)
MNHPRTVLITGASSGFGKLTTSLLLSRGHTVIAALRGGQRRLEAIYEPAELESGRLLCADVHMERSETFEPLRELVQGRCGGRLDVLINNAGYGLIAPVEDLPEDRIRHQLEVNFFGPVLLTNLLLPALRAARGRILNISSVAGLAAMPFYAVYSASKFALEGYSEALALDLRDSGVQVGLVEPGGFNTDFSPTASQSTALVPEGSRHGEAAAKATRFFAEKAARLTADPMIVARRLVKLCLRRRVPMRTIVGADARGLALLRWLLPDRLRLWISTKIFNKVFLGS